MFAMVYKKTHLLFKSQKSNYSSARKLCKLQLCQQRSKQFCLIKDLHLQFKSQNPGEKKSIQTNYILIYQNSVASAVNCNIIQIASAGEVPGFSGAVLIFLLLCLAHKCSVLPSNAHYWHHFLTLQPLRFASGFKTKMMNNIPSHSSKLNL